MKNTKSCPKCHSTDIIRIPDQSTSNIIPTNFTVLSAVYATRFVCAACGYTEQWIESPHDRERLRKKTSPRLNVAVTISTTILLQIV
jgi:predicted nucleic-acid-binding Zn-ribbon protein